MNTGCVTPLTLAKRARKRAKCRLAPCWCTTIRLSARVEPTYRASRSYGACRNYGPASGDWYCKNYRLIDATLYVTLEPLCDVRGAMVRIAGFRGWYLVPGCKKPARRLANGCPAPSGMNHRVEISEDSGGVVLRHAQRIFRWRREEKKPKRRVGSKALSAPIRESSVWCCRLTIPRETGKGERPLFFIQFIRHHCRIVPGKRQPLFILPLFLRQVAHRADVVFADVLDVGVCLS